ncbi:MAG: hypothetical protein AB8B93_02035 [Pseudomonadales bacterium]
MRLPLTLAIGLMLGGIAVWFGRGDSNHTDVRGESSAPAVAVESAPMVRATPAAVAPMTFSELGAIRSDYEQTYALYRLMDGQDDAGIEGLLDQARSQLSGDDFVAASAILYGRLAELNPERAVQRVLQAPGTAQASWLNAVFHAWARLDLDAALKAAEQLSGPFKQIAGRAVLRSRGDLPAVVRTDIAGGLSLQSPPLSRGGDFSQAWQEAMARPNSNQQAQGLMQIAALWASSDPAAAMQAATAIANGSLRQSVQGQIAMEWARQDPDTAFEWVRTRQGTARRQQMVQQMFQVFASADPVAAQQRAEQLSGSNQVRAMLGVLGPLAVADQRAAAQWVETLKSPRLRMDAIQTMTLSLAQHAPDSAEEWIATLPEQDGQLADMLLSSILVNTDPDRAARRVASLEDPQRRQNAASNLVGNWARQDVDATADWIGTMPESERGPLYQTLAARWSRWDSEAAEQFVSQLDSGIEKDHVRAGLLGNGAPLEQAVRLFEEIGDSDLKRQAAMQLYYRYLEFDPDQAERFRREAGVDVPGMRSPNGS